VDLPFDERRRTDLPQVFRGSAHFSKSMWKDPVKFFKIHPDCIWTGKYSSGSIAPGMLLCQQVMPEVACAQSPNPSRAGRRDHSKVLIEPVQEQSLRRHVAGFFSVHIGEKIPLRLPKRRAQRYHWAAGTLAVVYVSGAFIKDTFKCDPTTTVDELIPRLRELGIFARPSVPYPS
jgi:hypothetical protein